MKLEIIISTLLDGIFNIKINNNFNYLIIHQIPNKNNKKYEQFIKNLPSNVRYISTNTVGLSKSRNIGLNNAQGEYIWIMDDDVIILDSSLGEFDKMINTYQNIDMYVVRYTNKLPFEKGKGKGKEKVINRFTAMSISSINMIIRRKSLGMIRFNECFGLGSTYPSGEEYIFSYEFLKHKKTIIKYNEFFSYHKEISSGHDFYSTENKLIAKLAMFIYCYGNIRGRIIYLLFIIKKYKTLVNNKKLLTALNKIRKKIIFEKEYNISNEK
ncbi:TPA: glycosyltransferase family A protein [Proteus mirabilis]